MNINNSIAYLKRVWRDDTTEPDIVLNEGDCPCEVGYSNDMSIFFLIDTGDSFDYVQNSDLVRSKLSLEELLKIGVANLTAIAHTIDIKKNNDIFYFVGNGNFEASMILVNEIWTHWLHEHCPHGYVAALPARDILAVTDKTSSKATLMLTNVIERVWSYGDHLLTNSLYTRGIEKWVQFQNS